MKKCVDVSSEEQMIDVGQSFSYSLKAGDTVLLSGDLGAGKTTFVRGILKGLGYYDVVVSPTFSLVETYQLRAFNIQHFDLYRLEDERELELIGFRDYFTNDNVIIIEWPQRVVQMQIQADYDVRIKQFDKIRQLTIL